MTPGWIQRIVDTFIDTFESPVEPIENGPCPTPDFVTYEYGGKCAAGDILSWADEHAQWWRINMSEQILRYVACDYDLTPPPDYSDGIPGEF